jgi:hypothetical protein
MFFAGIASCSGHKDSTGSEEISGKWVRVESEQANVTEVSPAADLGNCIEFTSVNGKNRFCPASAHQFVYRMDSEFLYLIDDECPLDLANEGCRNHVQIYRYHLEADRLQLKRVLGFFSKPASHTYRKVR